MYEIEGVLRESIAQFVPLRKVSLKKYSIPRHIRALLQTKKKWYHVNKSLYRKFAKEYDFAVQAYLASKELRVVNSRNLSYFYSYANSKLKNIAVIPPLARSDGSIATSDSDKCGLLNQFFVSVFTVDDGILPSLAHRNPVAASLGSVTFTYDRVFRALMKLPLKYSKTPDNLPAIFLKSIAGGIAFPLSYLFNMSMKCGRVPSDWKIAYVCPIFKKGDRKLPSNYRPVSLTSICGKVMESIISDSMIAFLRANHLLSDEQYGFLAKRSTCTQLLTTLNDFTLLADNKMRVDAVYIDFAKAFDSVSHSKLLLKATLYGFTSHLLDWLSSFLSDRFQCVYIHESQSTLLPVISGVPQGSVLGPLLFLIYINDLPDCLTPPVKVKIFADDTKLYSARYSTEDPAFSNSLSEFCNWSSKWQLNIAFQKCNVISFGNLAVPSIKYSLSSVVLEEVSSIRDLGVFLSSDLKFHIHCSAIAAKAHHRCALLLKGFHSNDVSILLQLFTTYVRPLLESNTQVWNPWLHQDIHSIEKVQRFFTRAVCRRAKLSYMDYGTRLRNLNLQSLEYRRVFFDLVMCYKIVFHLVDVDVSDFFVINSHVHFTRGNHFKLKSRSLPHHNFRLNFFSERVIPIWNSLPNSVVSASSVCAFKAHLSHVDLTPFCKLFPYK